MVANAAQPASNLLIIETRLDLVDLDRPAMAFYPHAELNNDPSNWWGPNTPCVQALLEDLGFGRVSVSYVNGNSHRGVFHASRQR
jgi:hypothetical protein